jgi:phosphate-selective porin OprO/OprP
MHGGVAMSFRWKAWAAATALAIWAGAVHAQSNGASNEDLERRVRELEAMVRTLQAQVNASNAQAPFSTQSSNSSAATLGDPVVPAQAQGGVFAGPTPSAGPQPSGSSPLPSGEHAGWKNGFFIQSPNKDYILRITGQIQADYRNFTNGNDTTDVDGFLVRRARLGIEATVFNYYEFRLLPDFGLGKTVIQDSYLNVHYIDAFQLEAGKFKEPVSYEQLIQDRFVPTLERSLIDQIVPARDVGVMVHGQKLLGNRFDYAIGVFDGEINGDSDTNNSLDLAYRGVVRPFAGDFFPCFMQSLQVGASGTVGTESETMSPSTIRTPAGVPWLTFAPNGATPTVLSRATGTRTRFVPELAYFYGPFGFFAEYIWMDQDMTGTAAKSNVVRVPFDGSVVEATYLLTGEKRTSYTQLTPFASFDPLSPFHSPGAWELVARISQLRVDDIIFAPGANRLADPTKYASRATEFTIGFNWYLNAWVRTQFNWEHAMFNDPVLLGNTKAGFLTHQDTVFARFQVIF